MERWVEAWFDDSGKGQDPVYLLAGYLAGKSTWTEFNRDWHAELNCQPTLPYLHANESQLFKRMTTNQRIERVLNFVAIIRRHELEAQAFILKHADYREFYRLIATHPIITKPEQRSYKNPYFVSFQRILTIMLARQAKKRDDTGTIEMIEMFFDDGMDRKARMQTAFAFWVKSANKFEPTWLSLLINKTAEFRDDKQCPPLQAADLLAWHLRKYCDKAARGNSHADDPIWQALRTAADPHIHTLTDEDLVGMLYEMRAETWRRIAQQ
jgi:Protein of unknown function (DUF3800)